MKTSFQDGCNAIYDVIVAKGITPESKSLEDIITAINSIQTDVKHTVSARAVRVYDYDENGVYLQPELYVDDVYVASGSKNKIGSWGTSTSWVTAEV